MTMSNLVEVKVPDIGDFAEVPIIDLFVKVGDSIKVDDAICTLESDKATMDVPSPVAGVVKEVLVQLGAKVGEGALLIKVESGAICCGNPEKAAPKRRRRGPGAAPARQPARRCRHRVRNARPRRRPRRLLRRLPLGRPRHEDGHRRALRHPRRRLPQRRLHSVQGAAARRRGHGRSRAHGRSRRHLRRTDRRHRQAARPQGQGRRQADRRSGRHGQGPQGRHRARLRHFLDPHHIEVEVTDGTGQDKTGAKKVVKFQKCIIAAGSAAMHLPFIPKDPRIVDSTGALELRFVPKKMLVIGGGIIGLEMATVYSTLGARVDVVEMMDGLMQGPDRDAVKVWEKQNAHRFDKIMLKTKTVAVDAKDDGLYVKFEGEGVSPEPVKYDMILQAAGRSPNGKKIGADKAGVAVTDRGFINVDAQMRTNVPHIFAIGDLVGQPMLAHKAVHEAHVAAEVAAGHKAAPSMPR
jgi:dihydrolipoamide dehydrogenase